MSGIRKRGPKPRIDTTAKLALLAALREGRRLEEVAEAYDVTVQAFYSARRRDPVFDSAWRDAHAVGAAAERAPPGARPEGDGEERIVPNNRRLFQRRKLRHVRFTEARQKLFLAHFCWSGDAIAAASEAGVGERTVYAHRRKDPAFAAAFREALDQCHVRLEAEAVRERLAAQQRLRKAIEESDPLALSEEVAVEFERVMKLLARWDRKSGRPGPREVGPAAERPWTFEEAILALDKRLRCLGVPIDEADEVDGEEDGRGRS